MDFEDENRIFELDGEAAYIAVQFARLDVPAREGVAFALVKKLLAFNTADSFPQPYRGGAFVGEHGSWDRTVLNGYQVVFVPFADGKPSGKATPFVQGFVGADGSVYGRPVGVAFDSKGALIIADDVGNAVWRVSANKAAASAAPPPALPTQQ